MLAGVSVDYYARLERGNLSGVSDSVLEGLARALQLDEAERAHLLDLARAASSTPRTRRRSAPHQVRPGVQRLLDGPVASWFRGTQVRHDGRIAASGMSKDVRFIDADGGVNDRLDEAYRTKYRRYPPAIVDSITSRMARSATLKLVPAS